MTMTIGGQKFEVTRSSGSRTMGAAPHDRPRAVPAATQYTCPASILTRVAFERTL